jgi:hypothetical protein
MCISAHADIGIVINPDIDTTRKQQQKQQQTKY